MLKDHLEQLVKAGHLKEFVVDQGGRNVGQGSRSRNDHALPPPLGIIKVIYATSQGVRLSSQSGVLSVVSPFEANDEDRLEKRPREAIVPITFSEINLEGTSQ